MARTKKHNGQNGTQVKTERKSANDYSGSSREYRSPSGGAGWRFQTYNYPAPSVSVQSVRPEGVAYGASFTSGFQAKEATTTKSQEAVPTAISPKRLKIKLGDSFTVLCAADSPESTTQTTQKWTSVENLPKFDDQSPKSSQIKTYPQKQVTRSPRTTHVTKPNLSKSFHGQHVPSKIRPKVSTTQRGEDNSSDDEDSAKSINVFQNVQEAISTLPKTGRTPIVCIKDVLKTDSDEGSRTSTPKSFVESSWNIDTGSSSDSWKLSSLNVEQSSLSNKKVTNTDSVEAEIGENSDSEFRLSAGSLQVKSFKVSKKAKSSKSPTGTSKDILDVTSEMEGKKSSELKKHLLQSVTRSEGELDSNGIKTPEKSSEIDAVKGKKKRGPLSKFPSRSSSRSPSKSQNEVEAVKPKHTPSKQILLSKTKQSNVVRDWGQDDKEHKRAQKGSAKISSDKSPVSITVDDNTSPQTIGSSPVLRKKKSSPNKLSTLEQSSVVEDSSSLQVSPSSESPGKDGESVRHGRRIRSPSIRYADDMILFPLKPRRNPKGNTPPKDTENNSPSEKPSMKAAECQTSELYALLTKSLGEQQAQNRKSPVPGSSGSDCLGNETGSSNKTLYGNAKSFVSRSSSGAVREIDFTEQIKMGNKRDCQIQVCATEINSDKPAVSDTHGIAEYLEKGDQSKTKNLVSDKGEDSAKTKTDADNVIEKCDTTEETKAEICDKDDKPKSHDDISEKSDLLPNEVTSDSDSRNSSCNHSDKNNSNVFDNLSKPGNTTDMSDDEHLDNDSIEANNSSESSVTKDKSGGLFDLISKVKCNLESVSNLPGLLTATPFYDSIMLEEEDYGSDSRESSPKLGSSENDADSVQQNNSGIINDIDIHTDVTFVLEKVKKDLADVEKLEADTVKLIQQVDHSQSSADLFNVKKSKDLLGEKLASVLHETKREKKIQKEAKDKSASVQVSEESASNSKVSSVNKTPITTADVILVDSATSSSDDISDVNQDISKNSSSKPKELTIVTGDADSTTGTALSDSAGCTSPNRRNIFDAIMNDYQSPICEAKDNANKAKTSSEKSSPVDSPEKDTGANDKVESDDCVILSDDEPNGNIVKNEVSEHEQSKSTTAESVIKAKEKPVSKWTILERIQEKLQPPESKEEIEAKILQAAEEAEKGKKVIDLTLQDSDDEEMEEKSKNVEEEEVGPDGQVTPKPLTILKNLESDNNDKMSAFQSKKLDSYLDAIYRKSRPAKEESDHEEVEDNEDNDDFDDDDDDDEDDDDEMFEDEIDPDFDEVEGVLFMSFPSGEALSAHVEVERKTNLGRNDNLLLGMCRMKNLKQKQKVIQKKYQNIKRKPATTRLKNLKIQNKINQDLRGMHKALEKYQKLFKKELYTILVEQDNQEVGPKKTSDITKIKGWKNKFVEKDKLSLSQSGRLHWRTEARLVKNLKPKELKDLGLNLKKKRRKNLIFTQRKGMSKGDRSDRHGDEEEMPVEQVSEQELANEDEEASDYEEDYSYRDGMQFEVGDTETLVAEEEKKSQSMLKAERIRKRTLLKRLRFGPEDESILRRLGGQRALKKSHFQSANQDRSELIPTPPLEEEGEENSEVKTKRRRRRKKGEVIQITTLTQSMALAALSALDPRFVREKPSKPLILHKSQAGYRCKTGEGHEEDGEKKGLDDRGEQCNKPGHYHSTTTTTRKSHNTRSSGCRYGCICHLCKFAEGASSEEGEMSMQKQSSKHSTSCEKEYCRLGCICESIGARREHMRRSSHCGKPECILGCICEKDSKNFPLIDQQHSKPSKQLEKLLKENSKKKDNKPPQEVEDKLYADDDEDFEDMDDKTKKTLRRHKKKFESLPKRESTYRLAKNLDAVSRKAMLLYETSEMYAEQPSKRRRKKDSFDESGIPQKIAATNTQSPSVVTAESALTRALIAAGQHRSPALSQAMATSVTKATSSNKDLSSKSGSTKSSQKMEYPPAEIYYQSKPKQLYTQRQSKDSKKKQCEFDDMTFDEMLESDNEDFGEETTTCARTTVYSQLRRVRQKCTCVNHQKNKPCENNSPIVISPTNSRPTSPDATQKSSRHALSAEKKSTSHSSLGKKSAIPQSSKPVHTGWHTQWVCLKTVKKKANDDDDVESYELRLLEMISNCNWEDVKQKILSKISSQISKDSYPSPRRFEVGKYTVEFLPKSDKPALIPPEVKAKVPPSIYSIRIKVERKNTKESKSKIDVEKVTSDVSQTWSKLTPHESPGINVMTGTSLSSQPSVNKSVSSLPSSQFSSGTASCVSGGISGLSRLQINRFVGPCVLKPGGTSVVSEGTSNINVSPGAKPVGSMQSMLMKPVGQINPVAQGTKTVSGLDANSGGNVGSVPLPKNVLLLQQNSEGQKVLCIPQNIPISSVKSLLPANSKIINPPIVSQKLRTLAPVPPEATSTLPGAVNPVVSSVTSNIVTDTTLSTAAGNTVTNSTTTTSNSSSTSKTSSGQNITAETNESGILHELTVKTTVSNSGISQISSQKVLSEGSIEQRIGDFISEQEKILATTAGMPRVKGPGYEYMSVMRSVVTTSGNETGSNITQCRTALSSILSEKTMAQLPVALSSGKISPNSTVTSSVASPVLSVTPSGVGRVSPITIENSPPLGSGLSVTSLTNGKRSPVRPTVCPISLKDSAEGTTSEKLLYGPFNNLNDIPTDLKNAQLVAVTKQSKSSTHSSCSQSTASMSSTLSAVTKNSSTELTVLPLSLQKDGSGNVKAIIESTSKDVEGKKILSEKEIKRDSVDDTGETLKQKMQDNDKSTVDGTTKPRKVLCSKASKELEGGLFSNFRMQKPKYVPKRRYKKSKDKNESSKSEKKKKKKKKKTDETNDTDTMQDDIEPSKSENSESSKSGKSRKRKMKEERSSKESPQNTDEKHDVSKKSDVNDNSSPPAKKSKDHEEAKNLHSFILDVIENHVKKVDSTESSLASGVSADEIDGCKIDLTEDDSEEKEAEVAKCDISSTSNSENVGSLDKETINNQGQSEANDHTKDSVQKDNLPLFKLSEGDNSSSSNSSASSSSSNSSSSSSSSSPNSLSDDESDEDNLHDSLDSGLIENVANACKEICSIVEQTKDLSTENNPHVQEAENIDSVDKMDNTQVCVERNIESTKESVDTQDSLTKSVNENEISDNNSVELDEDVVMNDTVSNNPSENSVDVDSLLAEIEKSHSLELPRDKNATNVSDAKDLKDDQDCGSRHGELDNGEHGHSTVDGEISNEENSFKIQQNNSSSSDISVKKKDDIVDLSNGKGITANVSDAISEMKDKIEQDDLKKAAKEDEDAVIIIDDKSEDEDLTKLRGARKRKLSHLEGSPGFTVFKSQTSRINSFNEEENIDIETCSDSESDFSEWRSKMLTRTEKPAASPCSLHSIQLKRKRKAQMDTIENVYKDDIEFSEGLVKTFGPSKRDTSSLVIHNSRERQRRVAIKESFGNLIETIYGQDDNGHNIPLPVEAIQGVSKIRILQKAKSLIYDLHLKSLEQEEKKRVLKAQNNTLIQRLFHARAALIQIGMPPARIQDILAKIKKTCQIIFSKREMVMKKQLETLKAAMAVIAKNNAAKTENLTFRQEDVESLTSDTQVKQNSESSDSIPVPLKVLINPMHATSDAPVPVQMVSSRQVLKMAEYNHVGQKSPLKKGNPEIYIDMAEESELNIKTEPLTEKTDEEMTELCTPVDHVSTSDGASWSVFRTETETEESYGEESDFQGKVIPKASGSASVQSPVFSDVDESETLFQRLEDDFGEKD